MSFLVPPTVPSVDPFTSPDPSVPTDPIGSTSPDSITPELALVSSELAEVARSRLPSRPWEVALRRSRRFGSGVDAPSRAPETRSYDRTGQRRLLLRLLVAATVVGALAVGFPRADMWNRGDERVSTPEQPVTSGETQIEAQSRLLPGTGYVVSPGGSFMTGASGRTIEFFTLPLRCRSGSRQLVIRDIPVTGSSLRFVGKAVGRAATVRLRGRILDREHVRGVVAARGPSCKTDPVAFSARVS